MSPSPVERRYAVVAVLAVLAVLVGGVGPWAFATFGSASAKDRIQADPPPPLFSYQAVAPTGRQIDQQGSTATKLLAQWWASHDTHAHDAQFVTWLEGTLPGPPSAQARQAEIAQVQALAEQRTAAGEKAATWLEVHGKKDVWKLAVHDQAELLSKPVGDHRKQAVKDMLKMSKTVADALGARYRQSAPYVLDPSLRPDHTVKPGQVCPCSYPSRHATAAAASRTYLSYLAPQRESDYRWTEDQIAYSRVYMAGHVPSDITGGALLGDLIGKYFLVTRDHVKPSAIHTGNPGK